ncbi:hypothetical protein D6851_08010 [Altericroceibacterium spongiae]|uniref:Uncharacterized protein n=1 Tax=Altericroceibacterium spongiae TaxID=2320269 RepID=A0A420EMJ1_9SPHN|nr:hypothetical protein [Altericroceibacterium spongiae]RKF21947.1 hypothetical protein D6851_08010 [Altericroceibacterium spongiae]
MPHEPDFLLFASDATLLAVWGGACLFVALIAMLAEWRRHRRKVIDAVGWMPWTTIFVLMAFLGTALLTMAVKSWFAP